jgi:hypothetical protein
VAEKTAAELISETLQVVESDLMKAHHYCDLAMQLAMKTGNMEVAYQVAPLAVGIKLYLDQASNLIKKYKPEVVHGR